MRVFALSDIHVDHDQNARWVSGLSNCDFTRDVLILAGDVSSSLPRLRSCLAALRSKFAAVLYVPGNHDLWIQPAERGISSFDKFFLIRAIADDVGVAMSVVKYRWISIVPLFSWYDFSFGMPCDDLRRVWMDFHCCVWPLGFGATEISKFFKALNPPVVRSSNDTVISFSHFLPRADLLPSAAHRLPIALGPVMGSAMLDEQVRELCSDVHIYGHSHVNRSVELAGIRYVNNAFGYPHEHPISRKQLVCVYHA
jgi:predicted phosphodiesterase